MHPTTRLSRRLTLTGTLVLVGLAGCGGSGSTTLSPQALAAKVKALSATSCHEAQAAGISAPTDIASLITYIDKLEPILTKLQSQLSVLKPSPADAAAYAEYLHFAKETSAKVQGMKVAAEQNDTTQVATIGQSLQAINPTVKSLEDKLGFSFQCPALSGAAG